MGSYGSEGYSNTYESVRLLFLESCYKKLSTSKAYFLELHQIQQQFCIENLLEKCAEAEKKRNIKTIFLSSCNLNFLKHISLKRNM